MMVVGGECGGERCGEGGEASCHDHRARVVKSHGGWQRNVVPGFMSKGMGDGKATSRAFWQERGLGRPEAGFEGVSATLLFLARVHPLVASWARLVTSRLFPCPMSGMVRLTMRERGLRASVIFFLQVSTGPSRPESISPAAIDLTIG